MAICGTNNDAAGHRYDARRGTPSFERFKGLRKVSCMLPYPQQQVAHLLSGPVLDPILLCREYFLR